jgi:hypothetical protein
MLEIIILVILGQKIARMARDRDRSAWPWVLLLIFCWYGGAFAAAVVAAVVMALANLNAAAGNPNGPPGDLLVFIGAALGGAICGAIFTFLVVSRLPDARDWDDEDDSDDYDRPARRRRRWSDDEEDEDDRWRDLDERDDRRRRSDDEDDYTRRGRYDDR